MQILCQNSEMCPSKYIPPGCEASLEKGGEKKKAPLPPTVTIGTSNTRNSRSKEQEIGITVYFCILALF